MMAWENTTNSPYQVRHRGNRILRYHSEDRIYEGIECCLVQLESKEYWIVANRADDDDKFEDIGPFIDEDESIINFRLTTEPL